jgi:hypothetical protein
MGEKLHLVGRHRRRGRSEVSLDREQHSGGLRGHGGRTSVVVEKSIIILCVLKKIDVISDFGRMFDSGSRFFHWKKSVLSKLLKTGTANIDFSRFEKINQNFYISQF